MSDKNIDQNKSDIRIRPLDLMRTNLPQCPICNIDADYSINDEKKILIACNNCEAEWQLFLNLSQDQLVSLKLEKTDKDKRLKNLKGSQKILGFWQHCRILDYSTAMEKRIKKQIIVYLQINLSRKKNEEARNELLSLGDFTLFNLFQFQKDKAIPYVLPLFTLFSDARVLPDLLRGFSTINAYDQNYRTTILSIIIQNPIPDGYLPDLITFYKEIAQTDKHAPVRSNAIAGLIKHNGRPGAGDLVPFILGEMAKEKDVDARATNLFHLQPIANYEQVIDFITSVLPDKAVPNVKLELPTSWLDAAKEVIKLFQYLSLGEIAANILIETGNRRGIESLLVAIVNNQLDSFILRINRIRYLFKTYPYAKEYLLDIIKNSKDEKRRQNAAGLLNIGEIL